MRRNWIIFVMACVVCYFGCKAGKRKGPNIRKVKLDIKVDHFEKDFFALDTNTHYMSEGLKRLKTQYGYFYEGFLYNIAAFSMDDAVLPDEMNKFIVENRYLYDSIDDYIPHLDRQLKKIENALKRAKIYFPHLSLPGRIITYIGPVDGYGCFASKAGLAIGLQQFLGPGFTGYQSDYLLSLFGQQRLHQFTPDYIAPSVIGSWIAKIFPDKAEQYTLKDKMIEEGRKLYVLKALLPDLPDSLIFGYSGKQMTWCANNTYLIKKYFEHEKLLQIQNPEIIVEYMSDNQRPDDLPMEYPNNIGKYLGFLYVKEYMKDHPKINLPQLMGEKVWALKF
ncbi:gliding motility protein GldB-related protein [Arachidicoccus terrestris]|uniref:gliding motility protein GldB-related protein n=1 Tax=Arachidicoccus terrestris TaxID=2875539 RepID=UPI001CC81C98|nr:hypothetical protein [Arachidicoccus terrestris]UAY57177.1 hypothetical protein K9M52_09410 [Arachidicoccus terrestris]